MKSWKKRVLKSIINTGLSVCLLTGPLFTTPFGNVPGIQQAWAGTTIQSEAVADIGPGVTHRKAYAQLDGAPQAINLVQVDLTKEYIKLRTSAPNDRAIGLETVSSQAKRQSQPGDAVVAAVNGDFFYLSDPAGLPIGMQIRNGEIVSGPSNQPVFGVTKSGEPFISTITMKAEARTVGDTVYSRTINSVNKRRLDHNLVLFTPAFGTGTKTNNLGTELVVTGLEMPIRPNQTYTGTIAEKRVGAGNTTIPADGVVLSGHGNSAAFLNGFQAGEQISFSVNLDKENVEQAIGGISRLVTDGRLAPRSEFTRLNHGFSRQPRTAVGIRGNQVMIVTVDGRQPGISAGMTLEELGQFMLDLGMEQALNFDGGGSTTFVVRQQGDSLVSITNRPSDGKERLVSNSLQVVSTAPQGELTHLLVTPGTSKIFSNSKQQFFLKGMDQYYNPIDLSGKQVQWSVYEGLGTVDQQGYFTAGSSAAEGDITANIDGVTVSTQVSVVDKVARVALYPNPLIVQPGNTAKLNVLAWDEKGNPVTLNNGGIVWAETGGTGSIDTTGLFTAGDKVKEGKITARVGDKSAGVKVYTGRPPVVLEDFEDVSGWGGSQLKAVAAFGMAGGQEPVQSGFASGELVYDFQAGGATAGKPATGTSAAYALRKARLPLEGRPLRLGLWVYGDGKQHWLRGIYYDGKGKKRYLDFAPGTGVNWTGWKYVTAAIPADAPLPLSLESIYLAEDRLAKKDKGVVFFDDLTAEYTELIEGLIPAISLKIPGADGTLNTIDVPVDQSSQPGNGRFLVVLDLVQVKLSQLDQYKVSLYKILDDSSKKIQRTAFDAEGNKLKALVDGLGEYELVENKPSFGDVTEAGRFGWAKRDIEIMAAKEIVKGRGENLFDPGNQVTRAEFLTMLVRAVGLKANPAKPAAFKDVQAGEWYLEPVGAAVAAGLTKGYDDGTFRPNQQISRLEMALLLSRAARMTGGEVEVDTGILKKFKDYKAIPSWAVKDLCLAVQQGLMQGKGKDKLAFKDLGNRAEATVLVKRYFDRYGVSKA